MFLKLTQPWNPCLQASLQGSVLWGTSLGKAFCRVTVDRVHPLEVHSPGSPDPEGRPNFPRTGGEVRITSPSQAGASDSKARLLLPCPPQSPFFSDYTHPAASPRSATAPHRELGAWGRLCCPGVILAVGRLCPRGWPSPVCSVSSPTGSFGAAAGTGSASGNWNWLPFSPRWGLPRALRTPMALPLLGS